MMAVLICSLHLLMDARVKFTTEPAFGRTRLPRMTRPVMEKRFIATFVLLATAVVCLDARAEVRYGAAADSIKQDLDGLVAA